MRNVCGTLRNARGTMRNRRYAMRNACQGFSAAPVVGYGQSEKAVCVGILPFVWREFDRGS
jgi:hypothetical protein